MNALELLNIGTKKLERERIISSKIDSELLLSNILKKRREDILSNLNQKISIKDYYKYKKLIKRRQESEPIAYIFEKKEFWSKNFLVSRDTLIPRPETELMVDYLSKIYNGKKIFILDVGTGSGCILISLLGDLKNSKGIGIDISKKALDIAVRNSKIHNVSKIKFLKKSINDKFNQKFDLIVSNPPYIKSKDIKNLCDDIRRYEPRIALDGGNDGLDLIKKVIYKARYILKIKGMLALEIGNGQYKKVSKILLNKKFKIEKVIKDSNENIRCIVAIFMGN